VQETQYNKFLFI